MTVRDARLQSEYEAMLRFRSDILRWEAVGSARPPDRYFLTYNLRSIIGFNSQGAPTYHRGFTVDVRFPPDYPRGKPIVVMASEPWPLHPNIWRPNGHFCLEGNQNWIPGVGVPLDALCFMIGQIIAYQEVNLNSPANTDPVVRQWVQINLRFDYGSKVSNPVDNSPIRLPDAEDTIRWGSESPAEPPRIKFG